MIGFCPLASGSRGNCIYLGTNKTKILIDVGISCKKLEQKLEEIDVRLDDIDAILITHEHMDHITGLKVVCSKYKIPVIVNSETAKGIYANLHFLPDVKIFTTNETFCYQDLTIHPFSIQHDTLDPVGFTIQTDEYKIGVCTDLGFVSSLVQKNLEDCNYLYLEANHDVQMVHSCNRALIYKQRVLGRQGHLSNEQCAELISHLYHDGLKHIYLAHLSSECNHEEKAKNIIEKLLEIKKVKVSIAYQDKISDKILF